MAHFREMMIFDNDEDAVNFALNKWRKISAASIKERGAFIAALSGGRSPLTFYKALCLYKGHVDLDKTHIFLADERFVPPYDKKSNLGLLREHLLNHIDIPESNIHQVQTEHTTLEQAAQHYEHEIRAFFRVQGNSIPEFDLIMLGIGEDGHTASLFPGSAALKEKQCLAIPVMADKTPSQRISLSMPVLVNARNIMFLVIGPSKAGVVQEIVEDSESTLPAALIWRGGNRVYLVLDRDAASRLSMAGNKP